MCFLLPSLPPSFSLPPVFLCVLCLLAALLPPTCSCPPPCLCSSDSLVVDCRGRGLSSLPPLHLLPPRSRSLLLTNNKLASLGAAAFANLTSLEVVKFFFASKLNMLWVVVTLLFITVCAAQQVILSGRSYIEQTAENL